MMETTFVIIKPDACRRGLIGTILSRFEAKGLEILAMRMVTVYKDEATELYKEHAGKPFFQRLVDFTSDGPSVLLLLHGNNAIEVVRTMMGATDCTKAAPGTIRGDFGITSFERTLVHASRTAEDVEAERNVFDFTNDLTDDYLTPSYRDDTRTKYSTEETLPEIPDATKFAKQETRIIGLVDPQCLDEQY